MKRAKITKALEWVACPDCGEETIAGSFTHELTCKIKTGAAHSSPVIDGEIVGNCEYIPEPGEGLEVTFTCYQCKAIVKQDASEDMDIDGKGNPVCSKVCLAAADGTRLAGEREGLTLAQATREYAKLDAEEHIHKAFYKRRAAAMHRLVKLAGVGGNFQDAAGTVYEIVQAKGVFVPFVPYEVRRTRRGSEFKGTLSLDRAEALGYEVFRKIKPKQGRKAPVIPADEIPF